MRVVVLLAMFLLVGCVDPAIAGPSLVLRFTLISESGEPRDADPGPHCGTARIEGDVAVVEQGDWKRARHGRDGFLVVLPSLEGPWRSIGREGYAVGLPAAVASGMPEATSWAQIGWSEGPLVDGRPVDLPHAWVHDGHGWRIEARLEPGPTEVRTFRMGACM